MRKPWNILLAGRRHAPASDRPGSTWLFGSGTIALVALMAASSLGGFVVSARQRIQLIDFRARTRDLWQVELSVTECEAGERGFVLTRRVDYLEPYFSGIATLNRVGPALLPVLDQDAAAAGAADAHAMSHALSDLRQTWAEVITRAETQAPESAVQALIERRQKQAFDTARAMIDASIARRNAMADKVDAHIANERQLLFATDVSTAVITMIALLVFYRRSNRESRRREEMVAASALATRRAERLFGMASILQSAANRGDAMQVLCATAAELMPGFAGQIYALNSAQDQLERSAAWGPAGDLPVEPHIAPGCCWAMKRGKAHLNGGADGRLQCEHLGGRHVETLEVPLAARGQVFGLVVIGLGQHNDAEALTAILPVAAALADSIALTLSSIALRELLRNQALRDPLTGLYNRRFLDEMLEHLSLESRRRQTPLSAIMIDLDYFKQLNDQFGHATGDAVLRAVAGVVTHALRATDIACRYGGEELAVLLPDCPLEMAVFKAEQLRARIAEVAPGPDGASVTASLGVAAIPETSATPANLMASADGALYQAKLKGRNRVVQAEYQIPRDVERLRVEAGSEP